MHQKDKDQLVLPDNVNQIGHLQGATTCTWSGTRAKPNLGPLCPENATIERSTADFETHAHVNAVWPKSEKKVFCYKYNQLVFYY